MTLDEIKELRNAGKKKWSKAFIKIIQPKIDEDYTYERIADWLSKEHDFFIAASTLAVMVGRQKRKLKKHPVAKPVPSASYILPSLGIIETEVDNSTLPKDFYEQIQEEVRKKEEQKRLERNADFFSKFGKK